MISFNWVVLGLLVQLASAVILDDAFIRDWTKNWVGQISQYEFQSSDSIIGLSDQAQLFNSHIDLETNTTSTDLLWRTDLSKFGSNPQFLLNKNSFKVYTYSTDSTKVYAWDSRTGILENIFNLKAEPLAVVNFFNRGVLLVNIDGSVELLPENLSIQPQLKVGTIKLNLPKNGQVKSSAHDGIIYISIPNNNKIYGIKGDGTSDVIEVGGIETDKIVDLKENLILTQLNEVKLIAGDKVKPVKVSKKYENVVLISSNYFAAFNGATSPGFTLYKVDGPSGTASVVEGLPEIPTQVASIEYLTASINDFLVVSTPLKKVIVDITGLLSDDDPSSTQITTFDHPSSPKGKILDFLDYDKNDNIRLIATFSLPGTDVVITKHKHDSYVSSSTLQNRDSFESQSGKYLIVNKPTLDEKTLDDANHLLDEEQDGSKAGEYKLFIIRWWSRFQRHLIELIEYNVFAITKGKLPDNSIAGSEEEQFGLRKLIIFVDEKLNVLVAVNTIDGSIEWARELDISSGTFIDTVQLSDDRILVVYDSQVISINLRNGSTIASYGLANGLIEKVFTVEVDGQNLVLAKVENSSTVSILGLEGIQTSFEIDDKYFIDKNSGNGYKLSLESLNLIPTWKLPLGVTEKVVAVESKASSVVRSGNGLGIVLADKSVLYKYLYPNIAAVVTYDEHLDKVSLTLVDIVTGSQLHEQSHEGESIDLNSFLVTMDNNWIIYSYFSTNPKAEQRIVVIDLFETGIPNEKANDEEDDSIFNSYNQTIGEVSTKSFIFPERILQLSHSVTKFGITTTNILAFTDSGSLVHIPKFVLNSRRIADREFTQADSLNDFRLTPYEPILSGGDKHYHVLNHKNQLSVQEGGKILSIATELESTSVVCYINKLDWFCTTIQPSLQYDTLGKNFAKSKLILTILLLLLGVLITTPMVSSKRLNAAWLDRS